MVGHGVRNLQSKSCNNNAESLNELLEQAASNASNDSGNIRSKAFSKDIEYL